MINNIETIASKYRMISDMHTHSVYSHGFHYNHGKGTILENVQAAVACGLSEIAITDHGPGHMFYGLDQKRLPEMRRDIEYAMRLNPGIKVYLGVEANIIDTADALDVTAEHFSEYDIVLAGYHYGLPKGNMGANILSNIKSVKGGAPSGSAAALMLRNTDMVIRALHHNDIMTLTHPGDKGPFDMAELARACEETNTLMEINTRHKHLTVEEIRIAMEYDVKFIIDSDAHKPSEVGNFAEGIRRALEAGLEIERIVNIASR